jgi:hypothetical protein
MRCDSCSINMLLALDFFLPLVAMLLIAVPIVALIAWGMSKLLVRKPPSGWWNRR